MNEAPSISNEPTILDIDFTFDTYIFGSKWKFTEKYFERDSVIYDYYLIQKIEYDFVILSGASIATMTFTLVDKSKIKVLSFWNVILDTKSGIPIPRLEDTNNLYIEDIEVDLVDIITLKVALANPSVEIIRGAAPIFYLGVLGGALIIGWFLLAGIEQGFKLEVFRILLALIVTIPLLTHYPTKEDIWEEDP